MKLAEPVSATAHSHKDIARIKEKLKEKAARDPKQYNSLCYEPELGPNLPLHQQPNRRSSKKHLKLQDSPARLVRSKSRYADKSGSTKLLEQSKGKHDLGALYGELMAVKSQYKKLKGSYQQLAQEKQELTARGLVDQNSKKFEREELLRELDRYRKHSQNLQGELERIRKECMRLVQTQKFKNRKLEEIIQQKDLMISFLRGELDKNKRESTWSTANQSAIMFYPVAHSNNPNISASNIVIDGPSYSRPEEDSLCFSRDHSKDMESISSIIAPNHPFIPKKECVVIKQSNEPFSEPSQCPTFQQRDEQAFELKESIKMPPRQAKKEPSKPKKSKQMKRLQIATQGDQNADNNSRAGDSLDHKLFATYGSLKQRKKASSSRKKI